MPSECQVNACIPNIKAVMDLLNKAFLLISIPLCLLFYGTFKGPLEKSLQKTLWKTVKGSFLKDQPWLVNKSNLDGITPRGHPHRLKEKSTQVSKRITIIFLYVLFR